ncbi:hypothetical protein P8452_68784 [Trifolium repens]|nr:hypothetical protein P8452_68784 [Trifolium repens]
MSIVQENTIMARVSKWCETLDRWFTYKNKGEWLKDMKGSISLTASIIATMTFSLAINPPGGVVQAALTVIFLLVSGIPMEETFTIWLLSFTMCITLIFLVLTFTFAAIMVTPDVIWSSYKSSFSLIPLVYHSPQLGKIKKKLFFLSSLIISAQIFIQINSGHVC